MGRVTVWTIGHSRHSLEEFLRLLRVHKISLVIDVRTFPSSKLAPQFNELHLTNALKAGGFRYLFLGGELGGRPRNSEMYDKSGRVNYGLLSKSRDFRKGIAVVLEQVQFEKAALLCSEGNPKGCHRHLLVGRVLSETGIEVINILPDGDLETYDKLTSNESPLTLFDVEEEKPWKSLLPVRHNQAQQKSTKD